MSQPSFLAKVRSALREGYRFHGVWFPFVVAHRFGTYCFRKMFGPHAFDFAGSTLRYHIHPYILDNERAVEIAIVQDFLRGKSGETLEVGNVLATYYSFPHDIVDKYEQAPGVINEDIVTYAPGKNYDCIVSISTLEHVGWDEQPKEPDKVACAITRLKELLKDNGQMLVTMPLGYNPHVDQMVREGRTGFSDVQYMLRISANNQWREARLDEVTSARFGAPFACANAIVIGRFRRTAS